MKVSLFTRGIYKVASSLPYTDECGWITCIKVSVCKSRDSKFGSNIIYEKVKEKARFQLLKDFFMLTRKWTFQGQK